MDDPGRPGPAPRALPLPLWRPLPRAETLSGRQGDDRGWQGHDRVMTGWRPQGGEPFGEAITKVAPGHPAVFFTKNIPQDGSIVVLVSIPGPLQPDFFHSQILPALHVGCAH